MTNSEYLRRQDGTYRRFSGRKNPQKICTFWPQPTHARSERTSEGDRVRFDLQLFSSTAQTVLENQTESSLRSLAWDTLPPAFRLCPPIRTNRECLSELVQQQLSDSELPVVFVPSSNGWNTANGLRYFLFGEHLILPPELEGKVSPPQDPSLRVHLDLELPERQAAGWFTHVLSSVPHLSLPLCLANILGLLSSRLQALGYIPEGWLWVIGRSSAGKTSLVQTLCCLYDRLGPLKSCTIPAGSTIAYAASKIQLLRDTVCIVDDKALTEGGTLAGRQTALIDSLVRSTTNNTTRGVFGRKEKPACCYIIGTAESGFQAESVANRGIVLEVMNERIDFSLLNESLDGNHHHLETFWFYFIRWLVGNQELDTWLLTRVQAAAHPEASHELESPRIASHISFFHMACDLMMDYFNSIELWNQRDSEQWRSNLHAQLNQLYERQVVLLSRLHEKKDSGWLARAIAELIRSGTLKIIESKRLAFPPQCDGFRYSKRDGTVYLCFHTAPFLHALEHREIFLTLHELKQNLAPLGIFIRGSCGEATRNINGERGIMLNWTRLVEVSSTFGHQKYST